MKPPCRTLRGLLGESERLFRGDRTWSRKAREEASTPEVRDVIVDMRRKSAKLSPKIPNEYPEFWQITRWPY